MILTDLLKKRRKLVVGAWFARVAESYPGETSKFLKSVQDQFANPVGFKLSEGIGSLFDGLVAGEDPSSMTAVLDDIIRVRAVQDFSASGAVGFVFELKGAVRESLKGDLAALPDAAAELTSLDDAIDRLGLTAFDVHMACRERIWELKAHELQRRSVKVIERFQAQYEERVRKSGSH